MRQLSVGIKRGTRVIALDEPALGNRACYKYLIANSDMTDSVQEYGHIDFQDGPVKESGINGCHQEDLIAIVIDRLQCFQSGDFRCQENALALTKLEDALHLLSHQTSERVARGVEGTNTA